MRILLVEDSTLLAERLREVLGQMPDIEIVATADCEAEAVAKAQAVAVDVIILDLQLRVGTGFGVLRALGPKRPTVIVLTNYAMPTYAQRARELGVDHFLDKARDFERLPDVLAAIQTDLGC